MHKYINIVAALVNAVYSMEVLEDTNKNLLSGTEQERRERKIAMLLKAYNTLVDMETFLDNES